MIPFDPPPEPPEFDGRCRQQGRQWLEAHPEDRRPKDFWSDFKPQLADGFRQLCAYSVMYTPVGTVDHYLSWGGTRRERAFLAYEWSNYRFCAGWINSAKATADDTVLDPFQVEEGWFEIILPSLQLRITDGIPPHHRHKAEFTLERLHLRDDERVMRQRREWYRMYQDGDLTLDGLARKAPLIAAAIRKQQNGEV
jgi:hypothetical protein